MAGFLDWPRATREEAVAQLVSRLRSYLSHQRASVTLGHRDSGFSLPDLLPEGGVLLVQTGAGALGRTPSALVGSAVFSMVDSLLRSGGARRALLVCEDFCSFPGIDWMGLLQAGRRSGCSLLLTAQTLQDMREEDASRFLGCFGAVAGFQMPAGDAGMVSRSMVLGLPGERSLVNQPSHHFLLRSLTDHGGFIQPVRLLPPRPPVDFAEESERAVRSASLSFTTDFAGARARLDAEAEERRAGVRIDSPILRAGDAP